MKTRVEIVDEKGRKMIDELRKFAEEEKVELDRHREFELIKAKTIYELRVKEIRKGSRQKRLKKIFINKQSMIRADFDRKENYFLRVLDLALNHSVNLHDIWSESKTRKFKEVCESAL